MAAKTIFTVGHSNHTIGRFIELLKATDIGVVVDTRSHPFSAFADHFSHDLLRTALAANGIKYVFMGRELGGRPDGEEYYDDRGFVLYWKIAQSDLFQNGLSRILAGIDGNRIALMCAEEDPGDCHRRLLVTRVLRERDVQVQHIRGDGRLQSEDELRSDENKQQLSLFQPAQESEWKSTRRPLANSRASKTTIDTEPRLSRSGHLHAY
jgi:uncharacterized protein (DUF488 family)